jgi:polyisoprenoid-binding protein YceI
MSKPVKIVIGAVVALLVLGFGGSWVYINLIKDDAPDRLTLSSGTTVAGADTTAASADTTDTTAAPAASPDTTAAAATPDTTVAPAADGIDGTWAPTDASQLGYRVKEVLFGQDTEGVGRTNAVTGALVIAGTTISTATFTVDMTTLESDDSRRDGQFNGRIMDTSTHPTATFTLTEPIDLGAVPADLEPVTATAVGELTLRGTTKQVTMELSAQRNGASIEVNGSYEIVFADWGIDNPSFGAITTEDRGMLEFLLVFERS